LPEQKTEAEGVTMKSQRAANRSRAAVIRVPQPARRPQPATPPSCRRRGVALIIVLGLLGLLLISAVSFAVLMRTERNAATNYRHTSSARQMLHAGLARAIEDINADIGADLCPAWTNRTVISGSLTNEYPENIFFSRDTGGDQIPARLLTKDVMTYIPVLYHRRLTDNTYTTPEWIPIKYPIGTENTIGRYAYAVIDTSGLLDAHRVYDTATNRWLGTSLGEVRLDPAILSRKDLTNTTAFRSNRDVVRAAGRYETVSELATLNGGIDYAKLANFEVFSRYSTGAVADVTTVNLFGLTTSQLELPLYREPIIQAFIDSGGADTAPLTSLFPKDIFCDALADYLDSDSVMSAPGYPTAEEQFKRPCTEKLPLLTSYGVKVTYTRTDVNATTYEHRYQYEPFIYYAPWPVSESSALDLPLVFKGAICFVNRGLGEAAAVSPSGTENSICKSGEESINNSFTSEPEITTLLPPGDATITVVLTNTTVTPLQPEFDMYVAAEVYNADEVMCYHFPSDEKILNEFQASLPDAAYYDLPVGAGNVPRWAKISVIFPELLPGDQTAVREFWAECVDPRFAYSKAPGEKQWYSYSPGDAEDMNNFYPLAVDDRYTRNDTPLYVSILTNSALAAIADLSPTRMDGCHDIDGNGIQYDDLSAQLKMHVANAPLQTLGELGYLLCGPWETVRLYDHFPYDATTNDYHRVLDTFELRDPSAVPVGKVNLNSAPVDVLALLYLDMPLRSEKSSAYVSGARASDTDARYLTASTDLPQTLASNLHDGLRANGPVRGLADLANVYSADSLSAQLIKQHLIDISAGGASGSAFVGEFEREAVIRNIAGLLTVKQQMFTIILRADAFTTRFASDRLQDGTVLSSATAIAQVYRDAAPPHKVTVRLLKILE
jgi:hypothetical protein